MKNESKYKNIGLKINDTGNLEIERVAMTGQEAIDQIDALKEFYDAKINTYKQRYYQMIPTDKE